MPLSVNVARFANLLQQLFGLKGGGPYLQAIDDVFPMLAVERGDSADLDALRGWTRFQAGGEVAAGAGVFSYVEFIPQDAQLIVIDKLIIGTAAAAGGFSRFGLRRTGAGIGTGYALDCRQELGTADPQQAGRIGVQANPSTNAASQIGANGIQVLTTPQSGPCILDVGIVLTNGPNLAIGGNPQWKLIVESSIPNQELYAGVIGRSRPLLEDERRPA